MKIFLPSDKCNGGSRENRPKSGQRRKRRQSDRKEVERLIDADIKARNDRRLGVRV